VSDPTPPAGSAPEPGEADTAAQDPVGGSPTVDNEADPARGRATAVPPPPPPPGPTRPVVISRSRWLPMVAAAIMILMLGIGIGVVGTVGVAAVARHVHHRGPAAVGPDFHRDGPRPPRFAPPNQRPLRPGLPAKPGQPVQPIQPASPAPSATG
jgi:hypothetical protein